MYYRIKRAKYGIYLESIPYKIMLFRPDNTSLLDPTILALNILTYSSTLNQNLKRLMRSDNESEDVGKSTLVKILKEKCKQMGLSVTQQCLRCKVTTSLNRKTISELALEIGEELADELSSVHDIKPAMWTPPLRKPEKNFKLQSKLNFSGCTVRKNTKMGRKTSKILSKRRLWYRSGSNNRRR
ncbi:978_t:CDS:2 [Ambispora gerdemannii]|uniref:978_t:CDS:1 n=1 Tax=Ambispora gerdemannii TaxID=144530 RepID=A0A9N9FLH9_9GLOM|nr:978_t:CDS:2 [Ambispora gerdemannii]